MIFWKVLFEALYFQGSYKVSFSGKTHWRPVVIGSSGSVGPWNCLTFSRVPSHHGLDYSACCPPTQICKRKKRSRKAKATTVPITAPWYGVLDSACMHKALKSIPSTAGERGGEKKRERKGGRKMAQQQGAYQQAWQPECEPQNLHGGGRESATTNCPLTPAHTVACTCIQHRVNRWVGFLFFLLCWRRKEGKKNKDVEKKEKEENLKSLLETRSLYS